jgi:Domain of unknown function (DUF4499)
MMFVLIQIIKIISTVVITSTIVLDGWFYFPKLFQESGILFLNTNISTFLGERFLHLLLWVGSFAITVHLIEAVIAAFYASSRNKNPIKYGIYTFFVGTVGLLELFDRDILFNKNK